MRSVSSYKRAFLYITRKKEKSILLFIILFIISLLILLGMSMNQTSHKEAKQLTKNLGGYFKIAVDYEKMSFKSQVDDTLIEQVRSVDGIGKYNAMNNTFLTVPELTLRPGKFTSKVDRKANLTKFLGNTNTSLHEYFILNILQLKEGRHITSDDVGKVMISRELADRNELGIGDTIKAVISEDTSVEGEGVGSNFDFEIMGIYDEMNTTRGGDRTPECDLVPNFIFMDETSSREIYKVISGGQPIKFGVGATFFAEDSNQLNHLTQEVKNIEGVDWDSLKLTANNSVYESLIEPLKKIESMTTMLVVVISILGAILLSLLLTMWERDRIHEAGVLMSIGISKRSIFTQHFIECLCLFLAAFLISWGVSMPLSKQVGAWVYDSTSSKEESVNTNSVPSINMDPVDFGSEDTLKPLEESVSFDAGTKPGAVLITGGIGVLIIILSVGLSFIVILRKKPKELLVIME